MLATTGHKKHNLDAAETDQTAATVLKCSENKQLLALAIISGGWRSLLTGWDASCQLPVTSRQLVLRVGQLKLVIIIFIIFHELALSTAQHESKTSIFFDGSVNEVL